MRYEQAVSVLSNKANTAYGYSLDTKALLLFILNSRSGLYPEVAIWDIVLNEYSVDYVYRALAKDRDWFISSVTPEEVEQDWTALSAAPNISENAVISYTYIQPKERVC